MIPMASNDESPAAPASGQGTSEFGRKRASKQQALKTAELQAEPANRGRDGSPVAQRSSDAVVSASRSKCPA